MKLYKINLVIASDSEPEDIDWDNLFENQYPEEDDVVEVKTEEDLPRGWGLDSTPYGVDNLSCFCVEDFFLSEDEDEDNLEDAEGIITLNGVRYKRIDY